MATNEISVAITADTSGVKAGLADTQNSIKGVGPLLQRMNSQFAEVDYGASLLVIPHASFNAHGAPSSHCCTGSSLSCHAEGQSAITNLFRGR